MSKQPIKSTTKLLSIRVPADFVRMIDDWRSRQTGQITKVSRTAAIRYLVEHGVAVAQSEPTGRPRR